MIKNVIFDCDGVLLASNDVFFECFVEGAKELGVAVTRDFYIKVTGGGMMDSVKVFMDMYHFSQPTVEYIIKHVDALYKEKAKEQGVPLKPYVKEVLDYLEEHQIKRFVASSSFEDVIQQTLGPHHVLSRFNGTIFGDMVKERKPDPEIYLTCMEKFGLKKEETIIVEDSMNGIKAAHAAGVTCIGVRDFSSIDEWEEKGYCIQRKDLWDAMMYVDEVNKKSS